MARWRHEALQRLPELREKICSAPEIMALWIDLHIAFERAYEQTPRNESLIARIYSYADWCKHAPRRPEPGHDPLSAVTVAFYEDIPGHPLAGDDMPRWFRMSEIMQNKLVFAYSIGEEKYKELLAFMQRNRHKYVERGAFSWKSML